jgi:hypothetical protein
MEGDSSRERILPSPHRALATRIVREMLSFQRRLSLPGVALFVFSAFAVHQLRYFVADGSRAGETLARQGHGYLELALPLLASLVSVLVAIALISATSRRSTRSSSRRASRLGTITAFAIALAAVFAIQESAEGLLSSGHPHGLGAVLSHGGWVVLPLSVGFGILLTLVIETLAVVELRVAGRLSRAASRAPVLVGREFRSRITPLACRALAFGFARRPPPGIASAR